jgi:drug/metabolite transporter (DMT)-like permease
MNWQLLLAISIFTESFGRLIQRVLVKDEKSDPIAYAIVFQVITGLLIAVYAAFQGFTMPQFSAAPINFLLVPVLYILVNIFIFKSLKHTEASIFTVLFASRALWIVVGAILLLNESFNLQQIVGTLFILAAVVLVSWKKQSFSMKKGEWYAVIAAVCIACAFLNDTVIAKLVDIPSFMVYSFLSPALLMWGIFVKRTKNIIKIVQSSAMQKIVILSALYGIAAITYLTAYKIGNNAAVIGSIFQVSSVVTVFLAIFILRERGQYMKKIIAAVLSFIGVLLIG